MAGPQLGCSEYCWGFAHLSLTWAAASNGDCCAGCEQLTDHSFPAEMPSDQGVGPPQEGVQSPGSPWPLADGRWHVYLLGLMPDPLSQGGSNSAIQFTLQSSCGLS